MQCGRFGNIAKEQKEQKCKSDDPDMKGCAAEDQRL